MKFLVVRASLVLLLLLLLFGSSPADASHVKLEVDAEFKDGFDETLLVEVDSPTDVQISPDGTMMLVTSKEGKLWTVEDFQEKNPTPKLALNIKKLCTNIERGLSGVAFHPNFKQNRWIYVYYTFDMYNDCDASGAVNKGPVNRLSRFVMGKDNTLNMDDEEVFFNTPIMPYGAHNSGCIAFGNDGHLYVSVGDGSGGISKTNDDGILYPMALDMLLGKILRLTDTGGIPADNPYVSEKSERCHKTGWTSSAKIKCLEIFSYGLRNAFRFAIDPNEKSRTRIFLNDVGRHTWESIRESGDGYGGANYGYPEREGPCKKKRDTGCKPDSDYVDPIHWFHHDDEDGGAVTGGAFYPNGIGWPASFQDSYIYANYAYGGLYRIKEGKDGCPYPQCDPPISNYMSSTQVLSALKRVVSIRFGPYKGGQALYVATRGDTGNTGIQGIYRISYEGANNREPKARIETDTTLGFFPLVVHFDGTGSSDPDGGSLTYSWDFDGDGVTDSTSPTASFEYETSGTFFAKLIVRDPQGGQDSAKVRIDIDNAPPKPEIVSPAEGTLFAVGDKLTLQGAASDMEGDDTKLKWEVRLHHRDHFHQVLDPTKGNNIELPGAPEPLSFEAATTCYLVILLTATDSSGLSSTTSMIVQPKRVNVTIDSNPSGLYVTANGNEFKTPATVIAWENQRINIKTQSQTADNAAYAFEQWSDGGGRSHEFIASASNPLPVVAEFKMLSPKLQIDSPTDGSTFAVGDIIVLSGSATSGSSKMADSALTWEVHMKNKTHLKTLLPPTAGNNIVLDGMPPPDSFDFASTSVNLEIILTATLGLGFSSTSRLVLQPRKVDLVFDTNPSGLYLILNGHIHRTPAEITTWEHHEFEVEAPSQRMGNVTVESYVWKSWSDGGSQSHQYVVPAANRNREPHTVEADFIRLTQETPKASSRTMMGPIASSILIAAGAAGIALVIVLVGRKLQQERQACKEEEQIEPNDTLDSKESVDTVEFA